MGDGTYAEAGSWQSLARAVVRDVEHWIALRDKREVRLFLSQADKLRALRLRTWSLRHKIAVPEILDLIVPALRKLGWAGRGRRAGLGVAMSTVTGEKAELILRDRLAEKYPDQAHVRAWRERERDAQRERERLEELDGVEVTQPRQKSLLETGDVAVYAGRYSARIQALREERNDDERRKRKPYRGSPWR